MVRARAEARRARSRRVSRCTCDLEEFEQLVEMYTPSFSQSARCCDG